VGLDPAFSIVEPSDLSSIIKDILSELGIDGTHITPDSVQRRISSLKSDLVSPEAFAERATEYFDQQVAGIYPRVQEELRRQNAVDFDDLLVHVASLLRSDATLRTRLDARYRFLLVDEYQDTNLAQYAIARALSLDAPNLCATGDPDQSIYSWRGANIANILHFEEDYPGTHVVRLETNYRSTGNIVRVADQLIRHNQQRKHKDFVTDNADGPPVKVVCHRDENAEAQFIAESIRDAVDTGRRCYRDFAVFIRLSSLSQALELAMRSRGIPYQLIGGYSFFERREVRDLMAHMRLAINRADESAFGRIVKTPPKGIGATTAMKLREFARRQGIPIGEACRLADQVPGIKRKPATALRDVAMMLDELLGVMDRSPVGGLHAVLDVSGYGKYLAETSKPDDEDSGQAVVAGLQSAAEAFSLEQPDATLADFIESVSLLGAIDERNDLADVVSIMTLHAAKGLEFPVVFLVAFENKILPHERAAKERGDEEERRLVFVGFTRAQEELTISYSRLRMFQGTRLFTGASPFLAEIAGPALDRQDVLQPADSPRCVEDDDVNQETGYEEPTIPIYRGSSEPSIADRFHRGLWVEHPSYGPGVILQIEGVGDARKATINFASVGARRFVLSKSSLKPVSGTE
jgi:DNA helicase-2/ATP-dependent DNA helicase PcrA